MIVMMEGLVWWQKSGGGSDGGDIGSRWTMVLVVEGGGMVIDVWC